MIADAAGAFYHGVWVFYALGPQLVICMVLGYVAARRSGGSMLHWLAGGFLAAVIPLVGVVVMLVLLRQASPPTTAPTSPT